jgi:hypothetical protein
LTGWWTRKRIIRKNGSQGGGEAERGRWKNKKKMQLLVGRKPKIHHAWFD